MQTDIGHSLAHRVNGSLGYRVAYFSLEFNKLRWGLYVEI